MDVVAMDVVFPWGLARRRRGSLCDARQPFFFLDLENLHKVG